jgi:tetratricopeptide (TPR) repeat protein
VAQARRALGDNDGALAALDRAVALEPESYWHRIDRARLLLRLGRWDEARGDLDRAVRIDPGNFLAYVYRAGLNDRQGRIDAAVSDYQNTLRLNPEYTFAYASLGVLYYLQEEWGKAAEALGRALECEPQEPAFGLLAALALRQDGRLQEAEGYLGALLARLPRDGWAYDIGRYLAEPAREVHVISATERERDKSIRARRLFYIASQLLLEGRLRTALTYLGETAELPPSDLPERRIARSLLARYGVEEE